MFLEYFSRQILFSRTFQDSTVYSSTAYSSTFQACENPDNFKVIALVLSRQVHSYLTANPDHWFSCDKAHLKYN